MVQIGLDYWQYTSARCGKFLALRITGFAGNKGGGVVIGQEF